MTGLRHRAFWAPLAVLAVAGAVVAVFLMLWRSELDAPDGAAPEAFAILQRVMGEGRPHPSGSLANAAMAQRIVAEFAAAGYAPRTRAGLYCTAQSRPAGCAWVENIVAEKPGAAPEAPAILVTAHYDSVAAGPGAGDDGAGTAVVLALARQLAAKPAGRNAIVFLIADAEETGLRGAMAFAESDPAFKRVRLVVNIEARGGAGPSAMFETGPGNAALVALLARTADRPVANSLAYEIYKRMPNDTDFTVYRGHGLGGYNFAFLGAAARYHSARDTVENLDPRSLAHHWRNAAPLVEALRNADLAALKTETDASYFDVFGRALVAWPSSLDFPIALATLLAGAALAYVHRRRFDARAFGWSAGAAFAAIAGSYLLGWALAFPLGVWPGVHPLDHPYPWPGRIALAAACLVAASIAGILAARTSFRASVLAIWLGWALAACVCAALAPGASYALTWPAAAFALAGGVETWRRREGATLAPASALGALVAAFFWTAHFYAGEAVLSFTQSEWRALILAPLALALVPLFALPGAWRAAAAAGIVMCGAALLAWRAEPYSPAHPRGMNILYVQDGANPPRWHVVTTSTHDQAFLKGEAFPPADSEVANIDGTQDRGRFKPAAPLRLAPPALDIRETVRTDGVATARGVLRPGRGGFLIGLVVPPGSGVRAVRVAGKAVLADIDPSREAFAGLVGLAGREAAIEIDFAAGAQARVIAFERSALPDTEEARVLLARRPADAAPVHSGDYALVATEIPLAVR